MAMNDKVGMTLASTYASMANHAYGQFSTAPAGWQRRRRIIAELLKVLCHFGLLPIPPPWRARGNGGWVEGDDLLRCASVRVC
jgi:hypothetical protein